MRIATRLLLAASLAVSAAASTNMTGDALPTSVVIVSPEPSLAVAPGFASNATLAVPSHSLPSAQATLQTIATSESKPHANATSSKPADAAGGAILPQMQGSMAGLLGFCIMSLIML